jgi:branched-chain amino acid transport system substrate-binding protein
VNKNLRQRAAVVAAVGATLALALAGCAGGTTSPTGTATSGAASISADDLALAATYTGGTAGAADSSATPIKVGFINLDGGAPSFPEATDAAKIAVQFINEQLSGIGGHPIEVVQCNVVQGDADAQKCAQQMVNDDTIQTVMLGMTVTGTGPIYSTIGEKKNVVGIGTFNPVDLDQAGVNYIEGAGFVTGPGVVQYASQYLKAKTLALTYDGTDPGAAAAAQVIAKLGPQFGLTVTSVPVSDSSQWSTALVSAGAQTADAVAISAGTAACVPAAQAIQQTGITAPVLTFGFCQDANVAKTLGDYPQWTYIQPNKSPIGIEDPDVTLYNDLYDAYAPDANRAGGAAGMMQLVFAVTKALNTVGADSLTVEATRAAVHGDTGPLFMGPPSIKCGQYTADAAQSLCDSHVFPAVYEGNNKWSDPTDGKGIDTEGIGFKN